MLLRRSCRWARHDLSTFSTLEASPKMLPLLYTPFGNLVLYVPLYVVNGVINLPHSDVSYFCKKCCNVVVTPC